MSADPAEVQAIGTPEQLGRRACVEKLGHRCNQLRRSKRLFKQNAVGHAFRCPIVGGSARHVDDGKCRIDLPHQAPDLPTRHRPFEVDVGYERGILDHATFEHRNGFLTGSDGRHVEAALLQGVMNDFLQLFFVLDNENYWNVFQLPLRATSPPASQGNALAGEMFKSEH
jgi:hypothetical protein